MASVSQRLALFQHVLDALHGLLLAAETDKGLAFQIQQVLFGNKLWRSEFASAGEDLRELSSDHHVVVGDVFGAAHQVQPQFHFGETRLAEDTNVLARLARTVPERARSSANCLASAICRSRFMLMESFAER